MEADSRPPIQCRIRPQPHCSVLILGIESSCDETSAAVVRDGVLLSNVTAVQAIHALHGGVVPELASRAHMRTIVPVVGEALRKAGVEKTELDAVAAVYGPGLIGSLLVGLTFGKSLALGLGIPFIGVNHMEAHLLSHFIEDPRPQFPFVNLTASGGHTQLVLVEKPFGYKILGETRDDAAGEAFDKVAKMLGLEYPGGPSIDRLAAQGNAAAIDFPRLFLEEGSFDFSFSGLKTSVLYYMRDRKLDPKHITHEQLRDLCAGFQRAVVDVLAEKLIHAARAHSVNDIALAGGVAANAELRQRLAQEARRHNLRLFIPRIEFCTDNGAMVAMVGFFKHREHISSNLELTAEPNLSLADSAV